jgi:hypothetical protein
MLAWARWDASALDLDNHPASQSLSVVTIASFSFIRRFIAYIAASDQSNDRKSQPGRFQSPRLRHLPELCGINGLSNREIVYQWGNRSKAPSVPNKPKPPPDAHLNLTR